ncbi:MAG: hypothetical protein ACOCWG_00965 [bacterium]
MKTSDNSLMNVIDSFQSFLDAYHVFQSENNLLAKIENVFEITTSLSDKNGRICRYVKHQERNDPKKDWPEGMTSEMIGYIIYLIILKNYYNVDLLKGLKLELEKSIRQHSQQK